MNTLAQDAGFNDRIHAASSSASRADEQTFTLRETVLKSVVAHTVTYLSVGWLALIWLGYGQWFAESKLHCFMRPVSDQLVMAGPLFQPLRGALFGLVFYVLRSSSLSRKRGWLIMWMVLVVLGILNTFGPTPGSIEGLVYTTLTWRDHLRGLPEVVLQSLLLSLTVFYWLRTSRPRWWNRTLGTTFIAAICLPLLGLLA
jgi:hypothetical protein